MYCPVCGMVHINDILLEKVIREVVAAINNRK